MKAALRNLLAAMAVFAALCIAVTCTNDEHWTSIWLLLLIFAALPAIILSWVDLARTIRSHSSSSRWLFALGVTLGVPQALLGLVCTAIGISIVGWVLYNSLISRQPEYRESFLGFGLGPILTIFGLFWIRDAFARQQQRDKQLAQRNDQADLPSSDEPGI